MRYLPLSDTDRRAMLDAIGVASVDDLFADVPAAARLSGPVEGLPMHMTEMAVERQLGGLAKQNLAAGDAPFFLGAGA
ncbi:MAG: glycine dehydrogenase, partial [Novosphingobium sp.]|nr:glycine dehydrogenase [Novosphingobium sp.]